MVATKDMWLLGTWNVASENEKLIFLFYLILINLYLNYHMWLMASLLDSEDLEITYSFSY